MEHCSVGAVARHAEMLHMTQMVLWIPLSNTILVKKWHVKQLCMFWALVTTFKLTLELWSTNLKFCSLQNLQIIKRELWGTSAGHGYRFMWYKLKTTYKVQVRRNTVMKILREEDPAETLLRKSRYIKRRVYTCDRPNNTWHADGNDILKQYGFPIHGCVDSRKVLWLKIIQWFLQDFF